MRKLILLLSALLVAGQIQASGLDFQTADEQFLYQADFPACRKTLDSCLEKAQSPTEKAEAYWRMARLCHSTEAFTEGREFAEKAIEANPKSPDSYMWHCVCAGWEAKSNGSVVKMAGCVPVMLGDIDTILEKLGRTDYSHAWHAKGEIYFNHPFKSNDTAAEYVRKAIETRSADKATLASYILLYKILATKNKAEARQVLLDGKAVYLSEKRHTVTDAKDFLELEELLNR